MVPNRVLSSIILPFLSNFIGLSPNFNPIAAITAIISAFSITFDFGKSLTFKDLPLNGSPASTFGSRFALYADIALSPSVRINLHLSFLSVPAHLQSISLSTLTFEIALFASLSAFFSSATFF